jgi:hypothetical protein
MMKREPTDLDDDQQAIVDSLCHDYGWQSVLRGLVRWYEHQEERPNVILFCESLSNEVATIRRREPSRKVNRK